jgi:hypothetical protein
MWCGMIRSGSIRRELVDNQNNTKMLVVLAESRLDTQSQIPTTSPALTSGAYPTGPVYERLTVSAPHPG